MDSGEDFYNFNPDLPEPFNLIHPFQLKSVQKLLSTDIPDIIDAIILFGSSLDLTCHLYSDLDLYILSEHFDRMEVYEKMHKICRSLKKRFDILVSNEADFLDSALDFGSIENSIMKKGVCIYAKEKSDIAR